VQRLIAEHGIRGATRRGQPWRTTTSDPAAAKRPDLVKRKFTAQAPNRLWVGDLTYRQCWQRLLLFAFVLDVYSRMIVGWQLASQMRTDLVLDPLRIGLGTRAHGAEFALVAHTDAGSQDPSADDTQTLDDANVLASVGSVGDCSDEAIAESLVD
jgi:transposase InsO family protein